MKSVRPILTSLLSVIVVCSPAFAKTLKVGPGEKYAKPSQAIKAAADGDVIEISTKGKYDGDVCYVRANNLTIRGIGEGRALLDSKGKVAGRKGIFVTKGNDITIENIEFRNAKSEVNAAGIRAEGKNLTIRNCRFFECHDAFLGGAGQVLIEHSEFERCGHNPDPATHNLYINGRVDKLIYRYNYSTHAYTGHLLKSRAKENWILYNRITDEKGSGSAVIDIPEGGVAVIIGNIIHKGPNGKNNRVIAYAMERFKREKNKLFVINNTIIFDPPNKRWFKKSWFIRTEKVPADFLTVSRNNLCVGDIPLIKKGKVDSKGDILIKKISEAGFMNPEKFDFRLKPDSPAVGKGVATGKYEDFLLTPEFLYLHKAKKAPLPAGKKLNVGACPVVP